MRSRRPILALTSGAALAAGTLVAVTVAGASPDDVRAECTSDPVVTQQDGAREFVVRCTVPGEAGDADRAACNPSPKVTEVDAGSRLWVKCRVPGVLPAPTTAPPEPPAAENELTNGCAYSARGVPECGAYFGAAVGGNGDPTALEKAAGKQLGVHRLYYGPNDVAAAVAAATVDAEAKRLPWISFKLPYSWSDMANGRGDAWARDLATRLASVPGPVWLAFHHEPEGDGPIGEWTRMQERLGPIVRSAAPNVGFTVIMTGWHELYGGEEFSLDRIWPRTEVDVAGFDVYNRQGTKSGGGIRTKPTDMVGDYFEPFERWARRVGTRWALAETGYAATAVQQHPRWIQDTYAALVEHGGVGFAYFDSPLNSIADWTLGTGSKRTDFVAALRSSPTLPSDAGPEQ